MPPFKSCSRFALVFTRETRFGTSKGIGSGNVMLMEKMGSAEFAVVDRTTGIRRQVALRDHLTRAQEKAMATQPDMILSFAHHLAEEEQRAGRDVAVYADVFVVLNGRPTARLVNPKVDLSREQNHLGPLTWILLGAHGS